MFSAVSGEQPKGLGTGEGAQDTEMTFIERGDRSRLGSLRHGHQRCVRKSEVHLGVTISPARRGDKRLRPPPHQIGPGDQIAAQRPCCASASVGTSQVVGLGKDQRRVARSFSSASGHRATSVWRRFAEFM